MDKAEREVIELRMDEWKACCLREGLTPDILLAFKRGSSDPGVVLHSHLLSARTVLAILRAAVHDIEAALERGKQPPQN